jgi:hypothetical protein
VVKLTLAKPLPVRGDILKVIRPTGFFISHADSSDETTIPMNVGDLCLFIEQVVFNDQYAEYKVEFMNMFGYVNKKSVEKT